MTAVNNSASADTKTPWPLGFANLKHRRHMGGMHRRDLILLSLAPLVFAATTARAQPRFQPTPQDSADLTRIETYLDGLRTLKAHFLQVAPNGAISQGTAWLDRPGRMRFQYDAPSPLLLVAGHGLVVFHDKSLNQTTNIPISRTPLGILLADNVHLTGDVTVTGMQRLPGQIQVSLVRTASPGDGTLTLIFADNPLALRQWTVVDAQRQETLGDALQCRNRRQIRHEVVRIHRSALSPAESGLRNARFEATSQPRAQSLRAAHAGHRTNCLHFAAESEHYTPT